MGKIKAVIFDMDGLLINSDPFWKETFTLVMKKVGVLVSDELYYKMNGNSIDEAIRFLYNRTPWQTPSMEEIASEIIESVELKLDKRGKVMDGVEYILDFFKHKNIRIALASSSYSTIINRVLKKVNIAHYFEIISSGENERYNKPHPGIYLNTLNKLGVLPCECMVFEDSINRIIAAKAASLYVVAVPAQMHYSDTKFDIADLKIPSLMGFTHQHLKTFDLGFI